MDTDLGSRLRTIREDLVLDPNTGDRGVTYRRFAELLNQRIPSARERVTHSALYEWENWESRDRKPPRPRPVVYKALLALVPGLRLDWLLFAEGEPLEEEHEGANEAEREIAEQEQAEGQPFTQKMEAALSEPLENYHFLPPLARLTVRRTFGRLFSPATLVVPGDDTSAEEVTAEVERLSEQKAQVVADALGRVLSAPLNELEEATRGTTGPDEGGALADALVPIPDGVRRWRWEQYVQGVCLAITAFLASPDFGEPKAAPYPPRPNATDQPVDSEET